MVQFTTGSPSHTSNQRWFIAALIALTGFVCVGFSTSSLPVLFSEIAETLNLDLVEIGFIWGLGSAMGVAAVLIGGPLIDSFGMRRSIVSICALLGIAGLLRAAATDFWTLLAFSILFGIMQPVIPVCLMKITFAWFPSRQMGLASGIMSAGIAVGLLVGARFSATVLSPALGGWQWVVIAHGLAAMMVAAVWWFVYTDEDDRATGAIRWGQMARNIQNAARNRELWILGFLGLGILALARGIIGYVPSYLRAIGWDAVDADTALSVFFLASLTGAVPLATLSDRLRSRHQALMLTSATISLGTALMYFVGSSMLGVYLAMIIAGMGFDGFMAIHNATVSEVPGIDMTVRGSAIGFGFMVRQVGSVIGPPLGNSLTPVGLALPFLLWATFGLLALTLSIVYTRTSESSQPAAVVQEMDY